MKLTRIPSKVPKLLLKNTALGRPFRLKSGNAIYIKTQNDTNDGTYITSLESGTSFTQAGDTPVVLIRYTFTTEGDV